MKRCNAILLIFILLLAPARPAAAEDIPLAEPPVDPSPIAITEVQTGSASGSDEFIELYNVSDQAVDISGWQLRYNNATTVGDGTILITELTSSDGTPLILEPGAYYVVHTHSVLLPQSVKGQTYSAKLSAADKAIGLFRADLETCEMVITDALAWGTSVQGEGPAVQTTGTGERLFQRKLKRDVEVYVDMNNNAYDFMASAAIKSLTKPSLAQGATPGSANLQRVDEGTLPPIGGSSPFIRVPIEDCTPPQEEPEPIEEPPLPPPITEPPAIVEPDEPPTPQGPVMPPRNKGLTAPQLSELLPNPAKPHNDATDEFIEIYNSNDAAFELSGFILESGKKKYTFPAGTLLQPRAFKAFLSADTKLALTNAQGQVRLLDPFGRVISHTDVYQAAKEGLSWSLAAGIWQWTSSPTPDSTNVIRKTSSKKEITTRTAGAKTASTSQAATANKPSGDTRQDITASISSKPTEGAIHTSVLALGGVLAVLYGAYEYRRDLANKLYQFRIHRAARREDRQSAKGR